MIGWVTQGLTKVLPQPDSKYKETEEKEEHTEVGLPPFKQYESDQMPPQTKQEHQQQQQQQQQAVCR